MGGFLLGHEGPWWAAEVVSVAKGGAQMVFCE